MGDYINIGGEKWEIVSHATGIPGSFWYELVLHKGRETVKLHLGYNGSTNKQWENIKKAFIGRPCKYCDNLHEYPHPIVQEEVYLPMDCPNCGRHRLQFNGYHVVCEKCDSVDWKHPGNEGDC